MPRSEQDRLTTLAVRSINALSPLLHREMVSMFVPCGSTAREKRQLLNLAQEVRVQRRTQAPTTARLRERAR